MRYGFRVLSRPPAVVFSRARSQRRGVPAAAIQTSTLEQRMRSNCEPRPLHPVELLMKELEGARRRQKLCRRLLSRTYLLG